MTSRPVVLDTNVVLDAFVFDDAGAQSLKHALEAGDLQWLATPAMRDELRRVLGYPKIVARLACCKLLAADVIARFDRLAHMKATPAKAAVTCADADDQMFIDLAVAHGCLLLSKDRSVLSMAARLAALQVTAHNGQVENTWSLP